MPSKPAHIICRLESNPYICKRRRHWIFRSHRIMFEPSILDHRTQIAPDCCDAVAMSPIKTNYILFIFIYFGCSWSKNVLALVCGKWSYSIGKMRVQTKRRQCVGLAEKVFKTKQTTMNFILISAKWNWVFYIFWWNAYCPYIWIAENNIKTVEYKDFSRFGMITLDRSKFTFTDVFFFLSGILKCRRIHAINSN